jgi:filamentous hemagglutinin family protein
MSECASPGTIRAELALAAAMALAPGASAQVVTDGTVGRAGALSGPNFAVTADLGRQVGGNLFHSFSQLNLGRGESATFSGPASVANIIGRVTGGEASTIDGMLRSTIPGADFYLFNPAGVAFGPDASIDVGGAFRVGTAHSLRLADGGRFDAANPSASTLTAAAPEAFGFLGPAGALEVSGSFLAGHAGSAFDLVGGAVAIRDGAIIEVASGPLGIASLQGAGEVRFDARGLRGIAGTRGDIRISDAYLTTTAFEGLASGSVTMLGGSVFLDQTSVSAPNFGAVPGGGITVDATERLAMTGGSLDTDTLGEGASGGISIVAPVLRLADGAEILASSYTSGAGGAIAIRAREVEIQPGARIRAEAHDRGAGGDISIRADGSVRVNGGGVATGVSANTYGEGEGGNLGIVTPLLEVDGWATIDASTMGTGRGGSITIDAGQLRLASQGTIEVSTHADGAGGNLEVRASESVTIGGYDGSVQSGLYAQSRGSGPGGLLTVVSPRIVVEDGGVISGVTVAAGRGGSISVDTDELDLRGGGHLTVGAFGAGDGGDLVVRATRSVRIEGRNDDFSSGMYAASMEGGAGGRITVSAPSLVIENEGVINAFSRTSGRGGSVALDVGELALRAMGSMNIGSEGTGAAGNLDIVAARSVTIAGNDGEFRTGIFAPASGSGPGGSVSVRSSLVAIEDGGVLTAHAEGSGPGGSVAIDAGDLILRGGGQVLASSYGDGASGSLAIRATGRLLAEGKGPFGASAVAAEAYAAGAGGSVRIDAGSVYLDAGVISTVTEGAGRGGAMTVAAGDMELVNGGRMTVSSYGSGAAGDMAVAVERGLRIAGASSDSASGLFAAANAQGDGGALSVSASRLSVEDAGAISAIARGAGRGGALTIAAGDMELVGGGRVTVSTFGSGAGGNMDVQVEGSLRIAGSNGATASGLYAASSAEGDGGAIFASASRLSVEDGGAISATTFGPGSAGDVSLLADRMAFTEGARIAAQTTADATGHGGSIFIAAGELRIEGGSQVSVGSFGSGQAGNLEARARRDVTIGGDDGAFFSGLFATSNGSGAGGSVVLGAPRILLEQGGQVSAVTQGDGRGGSVTVEAEELALRSGGRLRVSSFGSGDAGNLSIAASRSVSAAGSAELLGSVHTSGFYAETSSSGAGGQIGIVAPTIGIADGATVSARGSGTGAAGSIRIVAADTLEVSRGGSIATRTVQSDGGDIAISGGGVIRLFDGSITTSVQGGAGDGGNITIAGLQHVVLNASAIQANAYGGNGGNIGIDSSYFIASPGSVVEASSQLGVSGTVTVTAPAVDIGGGLGVLPAGFFDATRLLREACASRAGETENSFVAVGRGRLSESAWTALPSPAAGRDGDEPAKATAPSRHLPAWSCEGSPK